MKNKHYKQNWRHKYSIRKFGAKTRNNLNCSPEKLKRVNEDSNIKFVNVYHSAWHTKKFILSNAIPHSSLHSWQMDSCHLRLVWFSKHIPMVSHLTKIKTKIFNNDLVQLLTYHKPSVILNMPIPYLYHQNVIPVKTKTILFTTASSAEEGIK